MSYAEVTAKDAIRIERLLPGPIERVWAYLTEPGKRAQWFAGGPMKLEPGGPVSLVFHNNRLTPGDDAPPAKFEKFGGEIAMTARILECDPPHTLAFTWFEGDMTHSQVRFELTPRGKQVQLVLVHERLKDREGMLNVSGGWHAHLDILAARLEGRDPPKFWRAIARLNKEYDERLPR